ncbi:MAG: aminotransferase class I/II-fold pyridoxal phosphate-dependent enzyme [Chitinivibrionales bacterium]|nr:aminotransferase class I/II-fold pyridoxal phosphate-dependent enzyme [Chitinivibrionales bacterium]
MALNSQAVALNDTISAANPAVLDLLSERGKRIFFPKEGILAQTAQADGKDINATIGAAFEDDGTIMHLGSIAKNVSLDPSRIFPYAKGFGRPDLRGRWKEMMIAKNPSLAKCAISLPVATAALTHALSIAGYLFVHEGDEIILPDLYWGNYRLLFCNNYGASIKTFTTFEGNGFGTENLKHALADGPAGKKLLLLNFPNNPTGYAPTSGEADRIVEIITESAQAGNHIVVMTDDAYFGLAYEDGIVPESLFTGLAGAHENILAVKLDGATKEDFVWGFRVGFITFGCKRNSEEMYNALIAKTAGAIRGTISNAPNISQSLLLEAYDDKEYAAQKQAKFATLKKRYQLISKLLSDTAEYADYFQPLPFNSGYFMCVRLSRPETEKIRQLLLDKYSTGLIAISPTIFRIAYSSTPTDKLEKLFHNLYLACKETF